MPTNWTYTWRASGANKENNFSRTFTATAPPYDAKYRRITSITRRNGAFCNTGGVNDTATILGVETLVDTSTTPETVLLTSEQASCRVRGRNVSSDNYMTTEFTNIPVSVSHKIIAAWKNGSLEIRRDLTLGQHSDRNCHAPYHRDGYYHDDITLVGTDSAYLPAFTAFSFSASDADRLYAEAWQDSPFDFSLQTSIQSSACWEDSTALCRRLTVSADNLTDPDAPPMNPVSVSTTDVSSTSWSLTQADFDFSSARSANGFQRGCRYRVNFTFSVGVDAAHLTEDTSFSAEIDVVAVPLHLSRHGNGVAIGRYSSVTDENDTLFECAYPAIFEQGIKDHANSHFSTEETDSGAKWTDGKKIYRRVFTGTTAQTGHVSIGNFPSAPVNVLNFHGSFKSKSDGKIRPLPFASYASSDWNISPVIDGAALELYIGASNKGGDYWLIFEYTKEE